MENSTTNKSNLWSIENMWNGALVTNRRELKPRDHIYSGEIGKNYYERYLKMKGVEPDNPFDERVMRKFAAGLWLEEQFGQIFESMGIIKQSQTPVEIPETEDHLRISGRLDFVAGGIVDWSEAEERIKTAKYPDFVESASLSMVKILREEYPEGLEEVVVEVKSINSQVFWNKKEYLAEAYPHHVMQLYTYLKATGIKKGVILYLSKDDLTVREQIILLGDPTLEANWLADVRGFSKYWKEEKEPPAPEEIIFDKRAKLSFQANKERHTIIGCYKKNWEVGWSPYFKRITGFETEKEWEAKINPLIAQKNAVLKDEYKANNNLN